MVLPKVCNNVEKCYLAAAGEVKSKLGELHQQKMECMDRYPISVSNSSSFHSTMGPGWDPMQKVAGHGDSEMRTLQQPLLSQHQAYIARRCLDPQTTLTLQSFGSDFMKGTRCPSTSSEPSSPKAPFVVKPPEKKHRLPSAYNRFMKEEIQRIKAANPEIPHREAFSAAAKNWARYIPISPQATASASESSSNVRKQTK
ncbi:hypothetical protein V6N13_055502 [Hibiscus sabdariffa]